MAYYRNDQTGRVQFHPKSGIGASLGSTEIGEDGKPVKPRTSLAPTSDEIKRAKALLKDNSLSPIERRAAEQVVAADEKVVARRNAAQARKTAKTTEATTGTGESNQKEDQ